MAVVAKVAVRMIHRAGGWVRCVFMTILFVCPACVDCFGSHGCELSQLLLLLSACLGAAAVVLLQLEAEEEAQAGA